MLPGKRIYSYLKKKFHQTIDAILESKLMRRFAANYPRVYKIFIDRFSLDVFTGLPLTFLLLAFFANLFVLSELVDAFEHTPAIVALDETFVRWMFALRVDWIAKAFYAFSTLGS